MKRAGFLYVEVFLAMIIASLAFSMTMQLSSNLFMFYNKINSKLLPDIDNDRAISIIKQDLINIFIPAENELKKDFPNKLASKDLDPTTKLSLLTNSKDTPQTSQATTDVNKIKKYHSTPFVLKKTQKNFDHLYFFTTNILPSYSKKKPAITAVLYKLEPQKNGNLLNLVRYELETSFTDFSSESIGKYSSTKLTLLTVSNCEISLKFYLEAEGENKEPKEETVSVWPGENNTLYSLPNLITIIFESTLGKTEIEITPVCAFRNQQPNKQPSPLQSTTAQLNAETQLEKKDSSEIQQPIKLPT